MVADESAALAALDAAGNSVAAESAADAAELAFEAELPASLASVAASPGKVGGTVLISV